VTNEFLVGRFYKVHEKAVVFDFSDENIFMWVSKTKIIMKLNSYSIFSEQAPSHPDKNSVGGDQTSILRDLDPNAARFPERTVVNGRNVFFGAVLLLLGGGLAWLLISMQNGADSRAVTSGRENAKSEIVSVPPASSGTVLQENSVGKPAISAAPEVAAAAPAIIRGTSLSSPVQEALAEAKPSAISTDSKLDIIDKEVRPEPVVATASPSVGNRVDGVIVHREKKMDSHGRNSQAVAVKGEGSKGSMTQANRSSQNEKQATERDVEIITVLVK
jgi:hypothetical protein